MFGALPDRRFAVAGRALGLTAWDRTTATAAGAADRGRQAERVRTCRARHGALPAAVAGDHRAGRRDGRALARNARSRCRSTARSPAVEVGESLEAAVAREIHEEAGIAITDVRYFGSQPWPFTGSLMIGFTARWAGGEIVADPTEIADADWFPPDELPRIPPRLSIARELIDDFVRRQGATPRE